MKLKIEINYENQFTLTSNPSNSGKLFFLNALALAAITMLSACGGGGGGSDTTAPKAANQASPVANANPVAQSSVSYVPEGATVATAATPSLTGPGAGKVVPAEQAKPIIAALMAASATANAGGVSSGQPLRNIATRPINEDSRDLFNWAQGAHRALFPTNEPDRVSAPYEFRFYPSTGNHLGVANGSVFTLGPMNNGALVNHGTVEAFACLFKPDRCAGPGMLTSVPTPTYPAGSDALAAFNYLNKERARCGFGMVAQNAILDKVAQGHLSYIAQNGGRFGWTHNQTPGRPGFTGVTQMDRARALGYGVPGKILVGESSAAGSLFNTGVNGVGLGIDRMKDLLNAPYHALDLIAGYKEIGTGYGFIGQEIFNANFTLYTAGLVFNPGRPDFTNPANDQGVAADAIRTYPCDGSTGINRQLKGEIPNPVTPRNLETNPIGSSIMVQVRANNNLLITGATMQNMSSGVPVALLPVLTRFNDPNNKLGPSSAIIMPNTPLDPLTQYSVVIGGTNNGVGFERRFKFTTGADFVPKPQ